MRTWETIGLTAAAIAAFLGVTAAITWGTAQYRAANTPTDTK